MEPIQLLWGVFWATALVLFILDIRFSASGARLISGRKALLLCTFWVSVATAYGFLVGGLLNATRMLEFFTAYVVEYSLSVDNMFVFLMIFSYFNTPPPSSPRFSPNVFAVVGLRSLYFLLASIAACFRFLKTGVSMVLFYVGVKMMISGVYKIPAFASLLVVLGILMSAILFSLLLPVRKTADAPVRADLRRNDDGSASPER